MDPSAAFKRKAMIGLVVAVLVVVAALLFFLPDKGEEDKGLTKQEEAALTAGEAYSYDGFDDLSEHGFTSIQMDGIRHAFTQSNASAREFKINTSTIVDGFYDPDNPTPTVQTTFEVAIDNKNFKATVDKHTDLETIGLTLADATTGAATYSSGPINASKVDTSESQYLGD
jgi:hypothetical protein